jgi:hypothetical protein
LDSGKPKPKTTNLVLETNDPMCGVVFPAHAASTSTKPTQTLIVKKEMSVPYGQSVGGMW